MKFEVPFDISSEYLSVVNNAETTHSVFYGLGKGITPNARTTAVTSNPFIDTNEVLRNLDANIKKHLVCNGTFMDPDNYTSKEYKNIIGEVFCNLLSKDILDGVIVYDMYFLNLIADMDIVRNGTINIIPSINFKIDSISRLNSIVSQIQNIIGRDYFPTDLMVDRSLNRDLAKLEELVIYVRGISKETKVTLLANEGCLNHCSLKQTHDAIISYINIGHDIRGLEKLDRVGCQEYFLNNPSQILTSPFIRPEDLSVYSELCDVIKLSGRTLSSANKTKILKAYISRAYDGNLLDLLEAQAGNKGNIFIDNKSLRSDFINTVTKCDKACYKCNFCYNIFNEVS